MASLKIEIASLQRSCMQLHCWGAFCCVPTRLCFNARRAASDSKSQLAVELVVLIWTPGAGRLPQVVCCDLAAAHGFGAGSRSVRMS